MQCASCLSKQITILKILSVIFWTSLPPTSGDLEEYEVLYNFKTDYFDSNEDGFIYKTHFNGPNAVSNTYNNVNMTYLGADLRMRCKCAEYHYYRYVNCFDPYLCVDFPKDIVFKYTKLRITTTKIHTLQKGDLGLNNQHLENFMLDGKMEFSEIETGAFLNMSRLKNISISHNPQLKCLQEGAFFGCDNLDVLVIMENGFSRFLDFTRALGSRVVPNFRKLRVAGLSTANISTEDFLEMNGTKLHTLNIINCNDLSIDPGILWMLPHLSMLQLSENHIMDNNLMELMEVIAFNNLKIESFSFSGYNNLPRKILEAIALTRISHLSLCCFNKFVIIDSFPIMDYIIYLDLKNVAAANITKNAFKNLYNLKTLLFNQNTLTTIPTAVMLSKLENLDMSDNSQFENYFFALGSNKFTKMMNLKYLNLSMNNIRMIDQNSFRGLRRLKVLDLENTKITVAKNNTFSHLVNLEYLNLRKNYFPAVMMYPEIYNGLGKLRVLILSYCGIRNMESNGSIFSNIPNLQYLILSNNKIRTVNETLFAPLRLLKYIDLSDNTVIAWDYNIFKGNIHLQVIELQGNMLSTLTNKMMEDFKKLQSLDLRSNHFSCTCDFYGNVSIILSLQVYSLLMKQPPVCSSPEEYGTYTITQYITEINKTDICTSKNHFEDQKVLLMVSIAILILLLLSGCSIVYLYRWHIHYCIFWARLALTNGGSYIKKSLQTKRTYKYDVFVSYCNENQNFVTHLVSMLENQEPFMKLCVYERDFQIGTVISESVLESVADSRRTLLVISDAYIRSQWCRWEVQVAENHRVFFEDENGRCVNDTLIMVKLGDISASTVISPMLRYLMKTRIYLEWSQDAQKQKMFWKKLRQELCPPNKILLR